MTHTDASGVSTDSGGQEESYGWENIRKLSTRPSGGSGNAGECGSPETSLNLML